MNHCPHNDIDCPSMKEGCQQHGLCCACVAHHREQGKKLPTCLRGIEWEEKTVCDQNVESNIATTMEEERAKERGCLKILLVIAAVIIIVFLVLWAMGMIGLEDNTYPQTL